MALDVREGLEARGCLFLEPGLHFIGTGGDHLTGYCNVDPALPDVAFMDEVSGLLGEPYNEVDFDTVLSPAVGAIPIGHFVARNLIATTGRRDIKAVWADKVNQSGEPLRLELSRTGFQELVRGRKVLLAEDMINRMTSIRKLVELAHSEGAEIVGVTSIAANEGASAEAIGVDSLNALCRVVYRNFTPEACQEHGPCSEGLPIVVNEALGHGDEYSRSRPTYPGGYVRLDRAPDGSIIKTPVRV